MDLIELTKNINRHPWELSRAKCLIKEINKVHKKGTILDIGCGDKYFDKKLIKANKNISSLRGVDIFLREKERIGKSYWVNDYKYLDIKKFDTIIMMDVLEHVPNDQEFLIKTIKPLLNTSGKIVLTVPAHQKLFSKHDEALKHYRRYNIKSLKEVCTASDLVVKEYHYFYFSLLIARFFSRNKESMINNWSYSEKHFLTKMIKTILSTDYNICKLFGKLSSGLSLFAIIEIKKQ